MLDRASSEIRRWILENDWLEAIVALPEQLFYNTGIATYIWVLSNKKEEKRRGKVQLIDASSFWSPMRKSLGDKRREITDEHIAQIKKLYVEFTESKVSKIFNSTDFGYRKITVERPLRLNFQVSEERLARLYEQSAFANLTRSKKKDKKAKAEEEAAGKKVQHETLTALRGVPGISCSKTEHNFRRNWINSIYPSPPLSKRRSLLRSQNKTRPLRFAEIKAENRSQIQTCAIPKTLS